MNNDQDKNMAIKVTDATYEISFIKKLNVFFEKRLTFFFLLSLGIIILFSYFLFDVRISLSGDDAAYLERSQKLLDNFEYPSFQGPLYPVFLSPFIALFGINVVLLKVVSMFCILGFQVFTYFTLRNRIPALLCCAILLFISFNAEILYYASQTYSEAFYLFLTSWAIWFYVTHFIDRKKEYSGGRKILFIFLLDLLLLAMGLCRSVGYIGIIAVLTYGLSFRKQWKETALVLVGFLIVFLCWSALKNMLWHNSSVEFSTQLQTLLQKEPYNAGAGQEDFRGFLTRFLDNMNNYISFHFYEIWGLRKFVLPMPTSTFLSLLTFVLGLVGLGVTYRKNRVLFFLGLYTGGFLVLTFFIMQVFWNQSRLIIPVTAYLLLLLLAALYYFPCRKWTAVIQMLLPFLMIFLLLGEWGRMANKVKEASKITDHYYGLTPDWMNYVKASEWVAKNLPREVGVSCRKPSISFIYGKGKKFNGIMSVPSSTGDSFVKQWQELPEQYIVIPRAELEKNLPVNVIDTFRTYLEAYYLSTPDMYYVLKGEPDGILQFKKLLEVHKVGVKDHIIFKEKDFVIYPDKLLRDIQKMQTDYIITANLRIDPNRNTGRIINTVERYMQYISLKYPSLFVKVVQVGEDRNEPAVVWKVDYSILPEDRRHRE